MEKPCSDLKMGGHLEKDEPSLIIVDLDDDGRFVYEVHGINHEEAEKRCEVKQKEV